MKWMQVAFAAASVVFLSAQTAPDQNAVMAHYRAYRAALGAADLATAETEAAAALAASVARDGEGGRTGVLAINLAQVRLSRRRTVEAYAPALQAFNIAATNSAAGVDPLLSRLVLGRAELTEDHATDGRGRLMATLPEVVARTDLHGDAYNAAVDLGRWLIIHEDFVRAIPAWEFAVRFADASEGDHTYARAEARLGEGVARLSQIASAQYYEFRRPTDTRLHADADDDYSGAYEALTEAVQLLLPLAMVDGGGEGLTLAQRTYSAALAWRTLLLARLRSTNQQAAIAGAEPEAMRASGPPRPPGPPACEMRIIAEPEPDFPPGARGRELSGAVVVRVLLNEQGQIVDTRVGAALPGRWFQEAVERVALQWRVERLSDSPSHCRVERINFVTIQFYFRS
ncbi:MAG: energy transducer TonB [Caulobacteraceae bacterium]